MFDLDLEQDIILIKVNQTDIGWFIRYIYY